MREIRNSGERTLAACWSRHSAATDFLGSFQGGAHVGQKKIVFAECENQHAASVRSPECSIQGVTR
jgi:hypothetical protein